MQFHHNITQHNMSLDQVKFHHRNIRASYSNHSHPTQNETDTKTQTSLRIILLFVLFIQLKIYLIFDLKI